MTPEELLLLPVVETMSTILIVGLGFTIGKLLTKNNL